MTCARGCCPSQALHYKSLNFTPRLHPATLTEREWDKDMPAYKRLRADGIQPRDIDGCAKLEAKAETTREIEAGQVLTPSQRRQVSEMLGD
jgi:hypothetical protein